MLLHLRLLLAAVVFALLSAPLRATWSIIIIDTRTGEIAIASATCLTGFDLQLNACVIVVGRGAAAAQSFVDFTGQNRQLIFQQLASGTPPAQILAMLAAADPQHQTRQYGIVDVQGNAIGFTGTGAGAWAGHLTGQIGTLVYAIQGNVLTGQPVITAAEAALRAAPGDVADKLVAAMEAARAMGGDGRCSCNSGAPTSCGSPPASFVKSAHIGYLLIARPGDSDGVCNGNVGCANGSYYLNLNVANQNSNDPDPVLQLRTAFLNWRLQHVLRPDHFRSEVTLAPSTLLADGRTRTVATVVLKDWRSARLPWGGANVQVALASTSTANVTLGSVTDHGDGSYSLPITAGTTVGTAQLRITVDDGQGPVQLAPDAAVQVTSDALWLDRSGIDALAGGNLGFTLDAGQAGAGRVYVLLGSASGSAPGLTVAPNLVLPLNSDPFLLLTLDLAARGALPDLLSSLDGQGRKLANVAVPPGVLWPLRQGALTFAYALLGPVDFTSNPVRLDVR